MFAVGVALLILFLAGVAIGIYALVAPRRRLEHARVPEREPLHADTDWTSAAGAEFAGLSEAARCDLIFAVAVLDDERSQRLLEHALDDPSDAVALAAAHSLQARGRTAVVERFLSARSDDRAQRLAQTLELLSPE